MGGMHWMWLLISLSLVAPVRGGLRVTTMQVETPMDVSRLNDSCHFTVPRYMSVSAAFALQSVSRVTASTSCGDPVGRWSAYRVVVTAQAFSEVVASNSSPAARVVSVRIPIDANATQMAAGSRFLFCADGASEWSTPETIPSGLAVGAPHASVTVTGPGILVLMCAGPAKSPDGVACLDGRTGCHCELRAGEDVADSSVGKHARGVVSWGIVVLMLSYVILWASYPISALWSSAVLCHCTWPADATRNARPSRFLRLVFGLFQVTGMSLFLSADVYTLSDELTDDKNRGALTMCAVGVALSVVNVVLSVALLGADCASAKPRDAENPLYAMVDNIVASSSGRGDDSGEPAALQRTWALSTVQGMVVACVISVDTAATRPSSTVQKDAIWASVFVAVAAVLDASLAFVSNSRMTQSNGEEVALCIASLLSNFFMIMSVLSYAIASYSVPCAAIR